jgi:uncharacterized protein (UPF0335 family)
MTLGANQIGAYAADIFTIEDQIVALQTGKRDLFKAIREEHGKQEANALKAAIRLARMDGEKRDEAEAVDTEAQRMLAIIEKGRAPRATRPREIIEEFDAETGEIDAISEPSRAVEPTPAARAIDVADASPAPAQDSGLSRGDDAADPADAAIASDDPRNTAPAFVADLIPPRRKTAADNALELRPFCQSAHNLGNCEGRGKRHCEACLLIKAEAEGQTA